MVLGLFSNMLGVDLAIDLGTSNTLIFVKGRGIAQRAFGRGRAKYFPRRAQGGRSWSRGQGHDWANPHRGQCHPSHSKKASSRTLRPQKPC